MLSDVIYRLRAIFHQRAVEAELDTELRFHLESEAAKLARQGLTREEADRRARLALGGLEQAKEECRDAWGVRLVQDFIRDVGFAGRMLRKTPVFASAVVVTLALGIGASVAIFSVVKAVLLQAPPYREPDRLKVILESNASKGYQSFPVSTANFLDWSRDNRTFEQMVAAFDWSPSLTGSGEPEQIRGAKVSADFFRMLGVEALRGRLFLPQESEVGNDAVVVIGNGLWTRRFGADPGIVGKTISLDGRAHTIVGVLPPDFRFATEKFEFWAPLAFSPREIDRAKRYLLVFGRLRPGVTSNQAKDDMNAIASRLGQVYPDADSGWGVYVGGLQEFYAGAFQKTRAALLVLLGAVTFMLLIACANVANLLLARSAIRRTEIALRMSLGASRARVIRQLLSEGLLLSALGATLGLALASGGLQLLTTLIPYVPMFRAQAIKVDGGVLAFAGAILVTVTLVFGLPPALQVSRAGIHDVMKQGERVAGPGSSGKHLLNGLVVAEVSLALLMLTAAGLMIGSFAHLRRERLGFRTDGILTLTVPLNDRRYGPYPPRRAAFFQQALDRIEALPGVQSVGMTAFLPLQGGWIADFSIGGRASLSAERPMAYCNVISPGYFRTMGIRLLRGHDFLPDDGASRPAAIIDETMARQFWPGQEPLGQRVIPKLGDWNSEPLPIVGVVEDVKQRSWGASGWEPAENHMPQIYIPHRQDPWTGMSIVVRTFGNPMSLAKLTRDQIWSIDRDQAVTELRTMDDRVAESLARPRFFMFLPSLFAAVAVLLAAVGIYGVMSYAVTQRMHEIGIRVAIGAPPGAVLSMMLRHGMGLTAKGLVLGIVGSLAVARALGSLLYGVSVTDPVIYVVATAVFAFVALVASYLPARRACRMDPLRALRQE